MRILLSVIDGRAPIGTTARELATGKDMRNPVAQRNPQGAIINAAAALRFQKGTI
jgi:hypothetical protein